MCVTFTLITQVQIMREFKVLLDFVQFVVAIKLVFFTNILAKLTANPLFTSPDVPLSEVKIALDLFEAAIIAAADGGKTAKSALRDAEKKVTVMFKNLAHYVDRIANGNETIILSSGFNMSKQPVFSGKDVLTVSDGVHSGTAVLDASTFPRAASYVWKIAKGVLPDHENGFELIAVTTQSTFTIEGLIPATYCYFIVSAVTPDGMTDFCAPVTKLIN